MPEPLGFIGLGNMGQPMALNLLRAGFRLRVWNRTAGKAGAVVENGATLAAHSSEVAERGGVVFTMVSDDRALEQICLDEPSFIERLAPGGIHVSLSTISPATSRTLAEHHAQHNVAYVAAPVFGRPEAAAAQKLWICLSGPPAAKQRIEPMLAALGQGNFDFGEDPGGANVAKLCGNFLIFAAVEALAEALALGEKNGLDRKSLAELFGQTLFACTVYQGYGKRIAENQYEPAGFRLALGLKDINLVMQTAAASLTPMPLGSLLRDRFLAALAKGRQNLDWGAIALSAAEDAGIRSASSS